MSSNRREKYEREQGNIEKHRIGKDRKHVFGSEKNTRKKKIKGALSCGNMVDSTALTSDAPGGPPTLLI
jgi:hypothetical protein